MSELIRSGLSAIKERKMWQRAGNTNDRKVPVDLFLDCLDKALIVRRVGFEFGDLRRGELLVLVYLDFVEDLARRAHAERR